MKKFIRILEALILLAAIVVAVMMVFGPKATPQEKAKLPSENKVVPPPPKAVRPKVRPQVELTQPVEAPVGEKLEEPTKPPRFEDLPPEKQAQFFEDRAAIHDETFARRFGMTMEEWNRLSPKEKRILIRKGKRE